MDSKIQQLASWVKEKYPTATSLIPLSNDASNRRYFRFTAAASSYLAVDSPPLAEKNSEFIFYQQVFKQLNILVPEIYHCDQEQGFFIVTDFGDNTYLKCLNHNNVDLLYQQAFSSLYKLSQYQCVYSMRYSAAKLQEEMSLSYEWLVQKLLSYRPTANSDEVFATVYNLLSHTILAQPQVLIHKDYHSRNMLLTANGELAVIDFQDAMIGPITYDIVSLLRDCYIDWPESKIYSLVAHYFSGLGLPGVSQQQFFKWFDYMTLQRHLKTSGQFARFYLKNNDQRYLCYLPRVVNYILTLTRKYPEFDPLHQIFNTLTLPAICVP